VPTHQQSRVESNQTPESGGVHIGRDEPSQAPSESDNTFLVLFEQCTRKELYINGKLSPARFARNYVEMEVASAETERVGATSEHKETGIWDIEPLIHEPAGR